MNHASKIYETDEDIQRQTKFAATMSRYMPGTYWMPRPQFCFYDFLVCRGAGVKFPAALVEYKYRHINHDKYDSVFLDNTKLEEFRGNPLSYQLTDRNELMPFCFFVEYADGVIEFAKLTRKDFFETQIINASTNGNDEDTFAVVSIIPKTRFKRVELGTRDEQTN